VCYMGLCAFCFIYIYIYILTFEIGNLWAKFGPSFNVIDFPADL